MFLNRRVSSLQPSPTLTLSAHVQSLKVQGIPVINLGAGELDIGTPEFVQKAGIEAIKDGFTKYTAVSGIAELKKAISNSLHETIGATYKDDEIIVTVGAKQAIFNALFATVNDGDEVLIPAPYWVSYPDMVSLLGGVSRVIDCDEQSQFKLTPDVLEANLSKRVKWLLLNSPSNPTGAVYTRDELKAIADVLDHHPHVWILSDDIYRELFYTEVPHLLEIAPHLKERFLVVNGVSKSYAMTGWRIGYAAGPRILIQALAKIQSQQTANPCSIAQKAALAALSDKSDWLLQLRTLLKTRRDYLVSALQELGIPAKLPDGAFYCYACCKNILNLKTDDGRILQTDNDVASYFLDKAHVAVVPGHAFGMSPYLRISYACHEKELAQAVGSLKEAIALLKK